jgi:hypothetical protein
MRFAPVLALALLVAPAAAQTSDAKARLAAQREAMGKLAAMDGAWRGTASLMTREGGRHELVQTERVGPFLDGTVKVVEGRGYEKDGSLSFNALGVISYDPATGKYSMQSNAQGQSGTFPLWPTPDGFAWEVPAGPNAKIRYTATLKDGTWQEVGDYIAGERPPMRIIEMKLKRIGDTSWPASDAVPAK